MTESEPVPTKVEELSPKKENPKFWENKRRIDKKSSFIQKLKEKNKYKIKELLNKSKITTQAATDNKIQMPNLIFKS